MDYQVHVANLFGAEAARQNFNYESHDLTVAALTYLFGQKTAQKAVKNETRILKSRMQKALRSNRFFENQLANLKWQLVNLSQHLDDEGNYIFDDGLNLIQEGYNLPMTASRHAFLAQDATTIETMVNQHVSRNANGALVSDDAVLTDLIADLISDDSPLNDEDNLFDTSAEMTHFTLFSLFNTIISAQVNDEDVAMCVSNDSDYLFHVLPASVRFFFFKLSVLVFK